MNDPKWRKYMDMDCELIYMDRHRQITYRTVKVLSVDNGVIKGYCHTRKGPRIFYTDRILAILPKKNRRRLS